MNEADELQKIVNDLRDKGVSGDYDTNPVERGELAEILLLLTRIIVKLT